MERARLNMRQEDMADYLGISRARLAKWERAVVRFTVDDVARLSRSLGVPLREWLEGDDDEVRRARDALLAPSVTSGEGGGLFR